MCLVALICIFKTLAFSANPIADMKAKEAIKIIRLAYQSWANQSGEYLEPQDYLKDSVTGVINGQNILFPLTDEKFIKITLNWEANEIKDANLWKAPNDQHILLTWTNDRITGIKIKDLYNFDYTVNYNSAGSVMNFTGNELIAGKIQFVAALEMDGDRLIKIRVYENQGNKPWIRSISTFTYKGDETLLESLVYKTGKSNIPANLASNFTTIYKK